MAWFNLALQSSKVQLKPPMGNMYDIYSKKAVLSLKLGILREIQQIYCKGWYFVIL